MLDLDTGDAVHALRHRVRYHGQARVIAEEVRASPQRYVVSDLLRTTTNPNAVYDLAEWRAGDPLPGVVAAEQAAEDFPWNQPVVFRSGRYVVHRIDPAKPLGVIRVPDWAKLDHLAELAPDE